MNKFQSILLTKQSMNLMFELSPHDLKSGCRPPWQKGVSIIKHKHMICVLTSFIIMLQYHVSCIPPTWKLESIKSDSFQC